MFFSRTKSKPISLVLLPLLMLVMVPSQAQQASQLRSLFKKAEQLVWHPKGSRYQELYQQLHYYPLQPYLDQQQLMHSIKLDKLSEIDGFLTKYAGTPLDFPLRKKWLNYLAKRKRKSLFVNYFKYEQSAELTCTYYQYQLDLGYSVDEVLAEVDKLWLVGKSQPKVCDPLFKRWQRAGYLTPNKVWQRVALAADGGKHTLIPYLTKLLPKQERYLAKLWHKVRRDPAQVRKLKYFYHKNEKEAQILTYGLKRYIWRQPEQALKVFAKVKDNYPFTTEQLNSITVKFALALASKHHNKAQHWLHQVAEQDINDLVTQWRISAVLPSGDWQLILAELLSLPSNRQQTNQWQYWYGRSLMELGQQELSKQVLTKLAKKRHYYGFLAASYMQKPINLQDQPIVITKAEQEKVMQHDAAKRAFELFYLGRYRDARREWHYWLKGLTEREQLVAAKIANEKNWFDRAIFTLAYLGYYHDVELRFPNAFNKEINQYAQAQQIDPAWASAIARRESSFMTDANSSAGAKGLMQLMPATAKRMARKKLSSQYLFNAGNNIKLGTKYLRQLLDKHQGNQVLATAAYNAGPYRVKKWLKNLDTLPVDIWIETIPYQETREYVKSVMAYQQIYLHKAGKAVALFDSLLAMQIPTKRAN